MSDLDTQPTEEITDNESPVTEAENSGKVDTPTVEVRDGKMYVDGVRVYTRDDTNRIAANSKKEVESRFLQELGVDSLDSVKTVINQLQQGNDEGLNVESLRDAVKKREQTVEELKAELSKLRTETTLKEHIGNLQNAMPGNWSSEQRQAVVDLMKARNMLALDGDTFAIRNGDSFITDESGERPDYTAAVQMVGKSLGLPLAKQGVSSYDADTAPRGEAKSTAVNEDALRADPAYRNAYIAVRESNKSLSRGQITDQMVRKQMEKTAYGSTASRSLYTADAQQNKTSKRR